MDDKLLVRIYNVGLGDCIYLRVPDGGEQIHILIDCGNKFKGHDVLTECLDDLKEILPDGTKNRKKLDLLVVTHPHEDHFEGIDKDLFTKFEIERVWLSPAFNILNPDMETENYHALQGAAVRGLQELANKNLGEVSELAKGLLAMTKADTVDMLCNNLKKDYGVEPKFVTADTPEKQLKIFQDEEIKFKVLAPMKNIDELYLGGKGLLNPSPGFALGATEGYSALFQLNKEKDITQPENISVQDFAQLRRRINPSALSLVKLAGSVTNNLSVVLLLEWHGLRLLFPGDAEFKSAYEGEVKEKSCNGSWNVMWEKRRGDLGEVHFLKVGHHGSVTATPWVAKDKTHKMSKVLDSLLPIPEEGEEPTAIAIVSTERTKCWPSIPDTELMAELGKRVAPVSLNRYTETYQDKVNGKIQQVTVTQDQPLRTDKEMQGSESNPVPIQYIAFEAEAGGPFIRV